MSASRESKKVEHILLVFLGLSPTREKIGFTIAHLLYQRT